MESVLVEGAEPCCIWSKSCALSSQFQMMYEDARRCVHLYLVWLKTKIYNVH
jgi:hypothetical protein